MSYGKINDDIVGTLRPPGPIYFAALGLVLAVLSLGVYAFAQQVQRGLGVAGYQHPILWAVYITNFVFWVGIAHSGTLISAVLFLFRAKWRTSVARASEAMTVFAVMTAGLFPIIHLGLKKPLLDDPRFTNDRFGVLVSCADEQAEAVRRHLGQAGAEEVTNHA